MKNSLLLRALFSVLGHNVLGQYDPDKARFLEKKDGVQHPIIIKVGN